MEKSEHKVHYYETDKMAVVHHSNYIRWFEDARLDFLQNMNINFASLEEEGYISPVLSVSARYISPMKYGDTAITETKLVRITDYKYEFVYTVKNSADQKICAEGKSSHCFLDVNGNPVSLKKSKPEIWKSLAEKKE